MKYITGLELAIAGLLAAMIAGLAWLAVTAAIAEQREWDAFAASHECRIVERAQGTTTVSTGFGTAVGSNGNVAVVPVTAVSSAPARAAYLCNDGVTYWRNAP